MAIGGACSTSHRPTQTQPERKTRGCLHCKWKTPEHKSQALWSACNLQCELVATGTTQFQHKRISTNFEPPSYQPPRSHALEANGWAAPRQWFCERKTSPWERHLVKSRDSVVATRSLSSQERELQQPPPPPQQQQHLHLHLNGWRFGTSTRVTTAFWQS